MLTATTILFALSFAIYEAPFSCVLFTRENRVQELLQLGDLGRPISFVSHMQAMVFKPVSCCVFSFFLSFGIKESKGDAHTGVKPVERELLNPVGTFRRGGRCNLCPSHVWCKWTQISVSYVFSLFLINRLYGFNDKNGFQL